VITRSTHMVAMEAGGELLVEGETADLTVRPIFVNRHRQTGIKVTLFKRSTNGMNSGQHITLTD